MYRLAIGGMQHQAPIPEFVAKPFDDHRPIRRKLPSGLDLLIEQRDQIVDGVGVETIAGQSLGQRLSLGCAAQELTERPAEFGGPTQSVSVPER